MTHRAARIDSKEVQIEWEPANWFAATWRADQPLTKQPPRAFDTREAEANIDNFISKYIFDWSTVPCDLSLSTDEALF